jgi:hypothetical protein
MGNGFYRIHLVAAKDKDCFTFFVPLLGDGRFDPGAPEPYLLKCRWRGYEYLGEFKAGNIHQPKYNRLIWVGQNDVDYLTDFLTAPVRVGSQCSIYEGDTLDAPAYTFVVRDLRKL